MGAYNGARHIKEQLESILCQLGDDDEIVISDDGSVDDTKTVAESVADKRIRWIDNAGTHGFVTNFENALRNAKGDVIFLSDQDDVWLPDKVQRVLTALQDCDLVVHNADVTDGAGKSKGYDYFSTLHSHTGFWWNLYKSRCLGCCMAFDRKVLDACLPFPRDIVAHDYWIGMYALYHFKVRFIDDILIKYRRHGENLSSSSEKSDNSLFYKLFTKRYSILSALLKRR